METKLEVLGSCPIGQMIKETKIDRFGFFAGSRIYKLVRMDWWLYNVFDEGDKGICYSAWKRYKDIFGFKEVYE